MIEYIQKAPIYGIIDTHSHMFLSQHSNTSWRMYPSTLWRNSMFILIMEQLQSLPFSPPRELNSSSSHHDTAALWPDFGPLWVLDSLSPLARSAESSETDWMENRTLPLELFTAFGWICFAHTRIKTPSIFNTDVCTHVMYLWEVY